MQGKTTDYLKKPAKAEAVVPAPAPSTGIFRAVHALAKQGNTADPFQSLIDEWLEYCRLDLSGETLEDYAAKISKFKWWWFDFTGYGDKLGAHPRFVTTKECREFISYLRTPVAVRWGLPIVRGREKLSPASVASYGRTVRAFFGFLHREGYIEHTPFSRAVKFTAKREESQIIKRVEQEDLGKLFTYLTQPALLSTYTGCRNLAMVSLLLDTGIRKGELLGLTMAALDMHKGQLEVSGKTGTRNVYFRQTCKDALAAYLLQYRQNQQEPEASLIPLSSNKSPLFLTEDGYPLTAAGFSSVIRRIEKGSSVRFSAHWLRHSHATFIVQRVDLPTAKALLGHSNIATTMRYVHLNPDEIRKAYQPNSPLDHLAGSEDSGLKRNRRGRPRRGGK